MQKPPQRSIAEILDAYRGYLLSKVSKVRILGEPDERELKDVFVELSIVEQRTLPQHWEFLGMMDSAMRRRFDPFADEDTDTKPETSEPREKEAKRRVKPDDLLRRGTKAIVTGAPGSGKTTLLKYLALKAQEEGKRLAVWLELKSIDKPLFAQAERVAAHDGNLILPEIWLKHLKVQLSLSDGEIKLLRAYWQERFKANAVAAFLDGFDELQDEAIERSLNKCVREFASASHDNTLLISTRPYAQHKLGKERLQELEIEPLNQRQIEAFLNSYYPNDDATKSLLETLRERTSLRELLHVPLLLGIILRLHREGRFAGERLKLYETIIADLVHELDRSKSINRLFKISDERLRLDFLKFLAFERLLHDPLDEEEPEVNRIVFSYDLLKEKAKTFLAQECLSHNSRDLAEDALATPLLREVGAGTFAFTHLTFQEYLAAHAFAAFHKSNEFEGLKIFCRAYHNPTIVEMEVLPMTLGAVANADNLYAEIECWPESLSFTNLRLRARGLTYSAKINQECLSKLIDRLLEFVSRKNPDEEPYRETVINNFVGVNRRIVTFIEGKADSLIKINALDFFSAALALGKLGSDKAVNSIISTVNHEISDVRRLAVILLSQFDSDKAVDAIISALNDKVSEVRLRAVEALGQINSVKAIDALISSLNDEVSDVRSRALFSLVRPGYDKAVDAIISALNDEDSGVRKTAVALLRAIGSDKAVDALNSALNNNEEEVFFIAVHIGFIGSEKAVDVLTSALKGSSGNVYLIIAVALGFTGSEKAADVLISALNNSDVDVRMTVAGALAELRSDKAVDPLISALNDEDSRVRENAAVGLGNLGSDKAIDALSSALNDEVSEVRLKAVAALRQIHSEKIIDALLSVLNDNVDSDIDSKMALALGQFDPDKVIDALLPTLNHKDRMVCQSALTILGYIGSDKAIDALLSALSYEDTDIRLKAAAILRVVSPNKAADTLISAFNDSDSTVRQNAAEALGVIGSTKAVYALISGLKDSDSAVRGKAAGALGQISVEALISGLEWSISQHDTFACQKAVIAVGYYSNEKRTLDQLKQLSLNHKESNVREAAKGAADKLACKIELLGQVIPEGTAQSLGDNESRELFLVGEAFKVAAEAGHIFRPTPNSDWGIDGEIEFKNERGEASGRRVYLQLKSGDSYLRTRKRDGKEIFTVKKPRHAEYWQAQAYPVLLVIRDSGGQTRWMNVSEYLQRHGANIRQVEFQGEPFTAESVKQMSARFAR